MVNAGIANLIGRVVTVLLVAAMLYALEYLIPSVSHAATVTLTWDEPTTNIDGRRN